MHKLYKNDYWKSGSSETNYRVFTLTDLFWGFWLFLPLSFTVINICFNQLVNISFNIYSLLIKH